jgi:ketosteroid isomerase-like protein
MKTILSFLLSILLLNGALHAQSTNKEKWKEEIRAVEKNFATDLKTTGVAYAFHKYAAADAVIKRGNDSLIKGSAAINNFYSDAAYKNAIAEWTPDYIDVSDDGSLGYTYGKYKWTMTSNEGKPITYSGVFHTVWKRMKDGSWKYVWD